MRDVLLQVGGAAEPFKDDPRAHAGAAPFTLISLLSPQDWRLTTTNPIVTQAAIFAVVLHALTLRVGGAPHASACTQMAHWVAYSSLFTTSLVLRGVGGLDAGVRLSDSVFVLVSLVYYDYSLNVAK